MVLTKLRGKYPVECELFVLFERFFSLENYHGRALAKNWGALVLPYVFESPRSKRDLCESRFHYAVIRLMILSNLTQLQIVLCFCVWEL